MAKSTKKTAASVAAPVAPKSKGKGKGKRITALPEGMTPGIRVVLAAFEDQPEERGTLVSDKVENGMVVVQVKKTKDDDGQREVSIDQVSLPQKANTAPKRAPMPNGKSVNASEAQREPVWSDRRVAVVKAMRKLGAVSDSTARTAEEICKSAGMAADDVFRVKVILDVYRTNELLHNGFAASCRHEGERALRYFLTKKGQKTTFPTAE